MHYLPYGNTVDPLLHAILDFRNNCTSDQLTFCGLVSMVSDADVARITTAYPSRRQLQSFTDMPIDEGGGELLQDGAYCA